MKNNLPRIMIAGANSGSGKTTVTCGILKVLQKRSLKTSAFKCGPDYIDPMFHTRAVGVPSKNLDSFFCDEQLLQGLFYNHAKNSDISVIEGVMGYYDGLSFESCEASSFSVAKATNTPVILVVNAKGMAMTAVALIKGIMDFKSDSNIKGVILNNVSKTAFEGLKTVIEKQLNIKVFGFLPNSPDCALESRHLGLVTPAEMQDINSKLEKLRELTQKYIDIDGIIELANNSQPFITDFREIKEENKRVKIGVAYDEAFSFYYKDNLELLEKLGCEIVYFSPLKDSKLPKNIDGIILGGGYPELYLKRLSENVGMLYDIKYKLENGLPCLAECGGFMYLHKEIEDKNNNFYSMVGVIDAKAVYKNKLVRFGYITLTNKDYILKAHEFHYWDSDNNGSFFKAEKPDGRVWECMHEYKNLICGFPHIFYYSNIDFVKGFINKCVKHKECR